MTGVHRAASTRRRIEAGNGLIVSCIVRAAGEEAYASRRVMDSCFRLKRGEEGKKKAAIGPDQSYSGVLVAFKAVSCQAQQASIFPRMNKSRGCHVI